MEKKIMTALEEVMDPELYISIVDLGLVYSVKIKNEKVTLKMTLTTMGCPLFTVLESDIRDALKKIRGIKTVDVQLVFEPPWSIEKMSEKAKALMGI